MNRGAPLRGNVERPVPSPSPHNAAHRTRRENAHRDAHSTASPGNANALRKTREQTRTNGRLFLSPPPLRARRSSENNHLHTVRSTRAYVRAPQLVFFFRLHLFTHPTQVTRYQRTMGEYFAIFSFTSFFCKRQNRKRRKTTVISTKQKHINCRFSSVALAVKENAQSLHPKHSIVQRVTHTR